MYCVYMHENKINHKKYVGITKQNVNDRWRKGKGYSHSTKFFNAIKKYGWDNFEHFILCDDIEEPDEAKKLEKYFVNKFNSFNEGYNMTEGGDSSHELSEEARRKISIFNKGRHNSPNTEFKKGHSYNKGVIRTQEQKNKISKGLKKYHNIKDDVLDKINSIHKEEKTKCNCKRKLFQYDLDGNLLGIFESSREAERKLKISHGNISLVCNHKNYSAGGYIWRFE